MHPYVIHLVCALLKYSLMQRVFLRAGEIVRPTYVCASVMMIGGVQFAISRVPVYTAISNF